MRKRLDLVRLEALLEKQKPLGPFPEDSAEIEIDLPEEAVALMREAADALGFTFAEVARAIHELGLVEMGKQIDIDPPGSDRRA